MVVPFQRRSPPVVPGRAGIKIQRLIRLKSGRLVQIRLESIHPLPRGEPRPAPSPRRPLTGCQRQVEVS